MNLHDAVMWGLHGNAHVTHKDGTTFYDVSNTYTVGTSKGVHTFHDFLSAKDFIDDHADYIPANDNGEQS